MQPEGNHLRTMKLRPGKLKCLKDDVGRDKFSELPDDVIVHILSFLPTLDAVQTLLLRRFGNLWTLVPTLRFHIYEYLDKMYPDGEGEDYGFGRFYIFIRNVLMLHQSPSVQTFCLCLAFQSEDEMIKLADDIKPWLKFSLDKQAKEIIFCDISHGSFDLIRTPANFTSQYLVMLELSCFWIEPQIQVDLGSLKKLLLKYISMPDMAFNQFISGCPSLEELSIIEPCRMKTVSFAAPNINKLTFALTDGYDEDDSWELDFPNLKCLDLEIDRIPLIKDVSSVQDVYLRNIGFDMEDEEDRRMFNIFFVKFLGAENFQLSSKASEPYLHRLHLIDDLHLLQIRWKSLVLELLVFCDSCLLGIYQLLRNLKHLEELTIYITGGITVFTRYVSSISSLRRYEVSEASLYMPPPEFPSDCVMPKLKTVTFHGDVKPWNRQLQLVEFLLKNAIILEKLVITPSDVVESTVAEEVEFLKHVSSYQRASTSVRVRFA